MLAHKRVENAFFGRRLRCRLYILALCFAHHADCDFNQVADNGVDIPAHITDLGELGCLDFQKRRACELCKTPGNFGFADACRSDHQYVFRGDFFAQRSLDALAAPTISKRDGDSAFGGVLADNETVEFGNNFAW